MFTALSEQLTGVLNRLRGRGVLSESDVTDALREIRRHLLEADVSFEVTRGFVERVRERAVGTLQVKAVSPGQQVVKLVHDEIATLLGGTSAGRGRTAAAVRRAGWSAGVWGRGRGAACCARTSAGAGCLARGGIGTRPDGDRRYRRPPADRRRDDGRVEGAEGGCRAEGSVARRRWDDGAGRGENRARVPRGRRTHGRDSDEARW